MQFLEVVFNIPVNRSFFYENCEPTTSALGFRVIAFFGSRKLTGFVVGETETLPKEISHDFKIKTIERIVDTEPLFTENQITLAKKIANYYLCSIGEVISAMIPSAKREKEFSFTGFSSVEMSAKPLTLSEEQETATQNILNACSQTKASLLYLFGITGSGKTEVYLQVISSLVKNGKSVIYLVPEISLTHQTVEELGKRFSNEVAVLHSGLTASEKLNQWKRILKGEAKIIVGARSAIFAPAKNLALVIIDEEHDGSYKANSTPRYHARQVAMMLSNSLNIPLLMGSATPSVEAWHLMEQGIIQKLTLTKRLAGGALPKIETVTMRGESSFLSIKLIEEIQKTKAEGKQAIVFLNRRGFARLYVCRECGFQLLCKNCSVPMTWHKGDNLMKCHYCGWQTTPPQQCPDCGSLEAGYTNFGTERLEDEIHRLLPECTVQRVDTDSVSGKSGNLQEKLTAFKEKKADILLGTQMVAKGLNFPSVKLVGIALADTGLQMPDFRASERTFALLTQVAGRAGRFLQDGKVIIQTLRETHPAIHFAKENNLEAFYHYELEQRKLLDYPPFTRLLRIVVRSKAKQHAEVVCTEISENLQSLLPPPNEVLGPAECMLSLIAGNTRFQVLLKGKNISTLQIAVKKMLETYKIPSGVYLEIDVDPISLL